MKTKKPSLSAYSCLCVSLLSQKDMSSQVIINDFDPDL